MTTLCFIRHGQTNWNKQKLIQGRRDFPLNEIGEQQTLNTALYLKENDSLWDHIISSPLSRAIKTAQIIINEINYKQPIIINNNVIEREFGEAEGLNICKEVYDRILIDDYPNIESTTTLQTRSRQAVIDIIKQFPHQRILIITHSHFIKGLLTQIIPGFTFTSTLYNASINYISFDEAIIQETNDIKLATIDYHINIINN